MKVQCAVCVGVCVWRVRVMRACVRAYARSSLCPCFVFILTGYFVSILPCFELLAVFFFFLRTQLNNGVAV